MSFANLTDFATLDVPCLAPDGREVVLVVVKATYSVVEGGVVLAEEQGPVRATAEVYDPSAEQSSVRLPCDLVLTKPRADVVVVGSAKSERPVQSMIVGTAVKARVVQLEVWGERTFYRGVAGRMVIGDAAPFVDKPIQYELARGGTSSDYLVVDKRNPVGRGVAGDDDELEGTPAPQIEDPARPITSAGDDSPPVGFGAIAMHWSPRCEAMGTLDEAWERERMPLMPLDFDTGHYCCAHPSLQLNAPLAEGDPVRIEGMTLGGPLAFSLPRWGVTVTGFFDAGDKVEVQPTIDTLVVDADARTFEVTGRAAFALGRGRRRLAAVRVSR
jgi:hypothetical protein